MWLEAKCNRGSALPGFIAWVVQNSKSQIPAVQISIAPKANGDDLPDLHDIIMCGFKDFWILGVVP